MSWAGALRRRTAAAIAVATERGGTVTLPASVWVALLTAIEDAIRDADRP